MSRREYLKYKETARALVWARLLHFNQIYNLKWNRISIKDTKTRWGSCSEKGNLNFNYRIVFLSSDLADYLIVHELCHLQEFNHSPRFWALVGRTIPNHLKLRRELKKIRLGPLKIIKRIFLTYR